MIMIGLPVPLPNADIAKTPTSQDSCLVLMVTRYSRKNLEINGPESSGMNPEIIPPYSLGSHGLNAHIVTYHDTHSISDGSEISETKGPPRHHSLGTFRTLNRRKPKAISVCGEVWAGKCEM